MPRLENQFSKPFARGRWQYPRPLFNDSVCAPLGLAFNAAGDLFVADGNRISFFTPNAVSPPTADVYATGVPGTNGLAFDSHGNLWTGDGGIGKSLEDHAPGAIVRRLIVTEEVFRIQPMNNGSALGGLSSGVGRVNSTIQPPQIPAANNPQNLVANGLAFNAQGNLLVADTARGALWLVTFDKYGNLVSKLGCDDTFSLNTLCLENLFRADPRLEGVDGIALDISGDIWASVNERNAIVFTVFFGTSDSVEVFRNPVNSSGLRNSATNTDEIAVSWNFRPVRFSPERNSAQRIAITIGVTTRQATRGRLGELGQI